MSDDDDLIKAAMMAMESAYAPYSGFAVGAAIRDEKGAIHCGVNVENAAYPQGTCAEAGAIAAMVAAGGRSIKAIAIAGGSNGVADLLCMPCGGCRQRIREFASADVPIIICGGGEVKGRFTLGELLPHSFGPDHLR